MNNRISKTDPNNNFNNAILHLKVSLLISLFRKYSWRYDEDSLHSIVEKYGIENTVEYIRKDQKFYNRIIRSIYRIVSIGKN